jgi:hypothetical protein
MKMAVKSGTYEATLEILKIKMEAEIKYPSEDPKKALKEFVKYIDKQLVKAQKKSEVA